MATAEEEPQDIIQFYNMIFIPKMKEHLIAAAYAAAYPAAYAAASSALEDCVEESREFIEAMVAAETLKQHGLRALDPEQV